MTRPLKDMSDKQLLTEFTKTRDAEALGALAARHELPLVGLARGLLGGRHDLACDAVQEVWVRVIRYGASFNGNSAVKTWLYRITVNQCMDMLKEHPLLRLKSSVKRFRVEGASGDHHQHQRSEREIELHRAMVQLSDAQRSVVLLCYHRGLTHEQAADVLEIPLGTLKSRLHAALERLRACLSAESEGQDHDK